MKNLRTKISIILIMTLTVSFSWSQSIIGSVYSVLNLGSLDYSYIVDSEQGVFYKTSAYQTGLLTLGSEVTMTIDPNNPSTFNIQVRENTSEIITCYATRIKKENFSMPLSSVYGMPVLENDILFFQDQNHFDEFYGILNDFSTSPFEEQRDLLRVFENQFVGFTSFNTYLDVTYNWEDGEFSEDELSNRYLIDFFQDYLIKALCNEFAEIGIGSEVHTMFREKNTDECITITVAKENQSLINEKRTLKFDGLLDFSIIKNMNVFRGGNQVNKEKSTSAFVLGEDEWGYDIELIYSDGAHADNVDCSIYAKQFSVGISRDCDDMDMIDVNNFSGNGTIDWGDGTTSNFVLDGFEGDLVYNSSGVTFTHVYAAIGTYSITYTINFTTEHFTSQSLTHIGQPINVIVGITCAEKSVNAPSQRIWIDGTYSMLCDAWINNWLTYKCVGSATEAWRKKNNGNMVKQSGNIQCSITAVYRNDDCTEFDDEYEHDSKYGKHVQTVVTKWFRKFDVQNGDTYSFNYYERNNAIVQTNIPLNPCN